ncbi:hypothetical protein EJ110_NYTH17075 [Nymphaea thermarum]|nr:hypothetical protein EJ110_NYTH17075 [Nymphaea thermarum]
MASQYNLRGAKGKEPAGPEETSPAHDQRNLKETMNQLVANVSNHEEALGFAAKTFGEFKEEMKLMATEGEAEEGQTGMGATQTINVVQSRAVSSSMVNKELMYLDVTLNGMSTIAMVDSGATHNFISREEAERMRLKLVPQQRTP